MGSTSSFLLSIITIFMFVPTCRGASGANFSVLNRCDNTVWLGIKSGEGSVRLVSTDDGFQLKPGESRYFKAPPGWSGKFWGTTCSAGDCRFNRVELNSTGVILPASSAEFKSNSDSLDCHDVSVTEGYNLTLTIKAGDGGVGAYGPTPCDPNRGYSTVMRIGDGPAMKGACKSYGNSDKCCSGPPAGCSRSGNSRCRIFLRCNYDDVTGTWSCTGNEYTLTFCLSSKRASGAGVEEEQVVQNRALSPGTHRGIVLISYACAFFFNFFLALH